LGFFLPALRSREFGRDLSSDQQELGERQRQVLRALVAAYVATAAPVGSATISHLLPTRLSSASIRNTLAELAALGLVHKPHASAGRVPSDEGIRLFIDQLLDPGDLGDYQRRTLDRSFDDVPVEDAVQLASKVLSDETRQLGFVMIPRLQRLVLRHVSFVRLSSERILTLLVDSSGQTHQRVIESPLRSGEGFEQPELDRMAAALSERVAGRTLPEVREALRREVRSLRNRASRLIERALLLGLRAAEAAIESSTDGDLVIATRLALLDQPEFTDPERVRELFGALEAGARLVDLIGELLEGDRLTVALGDELAIEGLSGCALVAAPYGDSLGALGVIGPTRMDYGRIIPLVAYCSQLVTEKLST
jgi:heat-inducible transcriptional repressor